MSTECFWWQEALACDCEQNLSDSKLKVQISVHASQLLIIITNALPTCGDANNMLIVRAFWWQEALASDREQNCDNDVKDKCEVVSFKHHVAVHVAENQHYHLGVRGNNGETHVGPPDSRGPEGRRRKADSPPDVLKFQLGPPPEDTEGPHIPEAGAKYATLRCLDGGKAGRSTKQRHGTHQVSRKELQKDRIGSHPEDTEGPHIPEARAKYATLRCLDGGNWEKAPSEDMGRTKCRAGRQQNFDMHLDDELEATSSMHLNSRGFRGSKRRYPRWTPDSQRPEGRRRIADKCVGPRQRAPTSATQTANPFSLKGSSMWPEVPRLLRHYCAGNFRVRFLILLEQRFSGYRFSLDQETCDANTRHTRNCSVRRRQCG